VYGVVGDCFGYCVGLFVDFFEYECFVVVFFGDVGVLVDFVDCVIVDWCVVFGVEEFYVVGVY